MNVDRALEEINKISSRKQIQGFDSQAIFGILPSELADVMKALSEPEETAYQKYARLQNEGILGISGNYVTSKPDPIREVYEKYNCKDICNIEAMTDIWQAIKQHCEKDNGKT